MTSRDLRLFADYFQFYIQDERATVDLSEAWNDDAVERMLAVAPGTVGIGTARNCEVPVRLEVHDSEPPHDFESWDHVTECSIEVLSGQLVLAGCTDYFPDAARVEIQPGTYRVRVHYGALDSLSADGLEGTDNYRVVLWLGDAREPSVLKERKAG